MWELALISALLLVTKGASVGLAALLAMTPFIN